MKQLRHSFAIVLLLSSGSLATVINVPEDQPTIQAGIDAAVDGDTVLVDTGRYVENINFSGKNIVVGSLFLTTEDTTYIPRTVIDGDSAGSVVTFESGETADAILIGLTVSNGLANSGGGIYCIASSPILTNLVVRGNKAIGLYTGGGGIYFSNCNPYLYRVTISGNSAEASGGGMYFTDAAAILVEGYVASNVAQRQGGGIYCRLSDLEIDRGTLVGNTSNSDGGGIALNSSSATLTQINVSENSSITGGGGGIYCVNNSTILLADVTAKSNSASYMGGGLWCYTSDAILENVVISQNRAASGGGCSFEFSRAEFDNVAVTGNRAGSGAGGIEFWDCDGTVRKTVVVGNKGEWAGGLGSNKSRLQLINVTLAGNASAEEGGAVTCGTKSYLNFVNSILWNDSPHEIHVWEFNRPSEIAIAYSNIRNGQDGILTNNNVIINWLEGNIERDPLFVDREFDDVRLQTNSPCIDAGTSLFVLSGDTLVGLDAEEYSGKAPDMGALEGGIPAVVLGDVNVSHLYATPGVDTVVVRVSADVRDDLWLSTLVKDAEGHLIDTLPLFDDGFHRDAAAKDGLFANRWTVPPAEERNYSLGLYATLIDTDTIAYYRNNVARFTTIGPIIYEGMQLISDTIPNPGDNMIFRITLKNVGALTPAQNVTAEMRSADSCVALLDWNNVDYGRIDAGETKKMESGFYVLGIAETCPENKEIPIELLLASDNFFFWSDSFGIRVRQSLGIADGDPDLPKDYALSHPHPNPFNPSITIEFSLPQDGIINLTVYDLLGREVATLVDTWHEAGHHTAKWNAGDVSSGVYFVRMVSGGFSQTRKVTVLR